MVALHKRLIVCILLIIGALVQNSVFAQSSEEYRLELGGAFGGSFYMGDANYTTPFKHIGVSGGVVARYILNQRMAIKGDLIAGRIAGDTRGFNNKYPGLENVNFKRAIFDLGAQFEYNFLPYGTGQGFRGGKRFTPYILGGMGFTYAPPPANGVFTVNFPIGAGVKYKLRERLNIGFEFTMRFSLSDKLDVTNKEGLQLNDPFQIKGKGFKNKDSYSFAILFLTYDLFPKCKDCNY